MLEDLRRWYSARAYGMAAALATELLNAATNLTSDQRLEVAHLGLLASVGGAKDQGDLQRALWFARELRQIAQGTPAAARWTTMADYYEGSIQGRMGNWAEAIQLLMKFLGAADETLYLADAWFNVAKARLAQRDTLGALHAFTSATDLYRQAGDYESAVKSLANGAWAAAESGMAFLGREYLNEAHGMLDRCHDPQTAWTYATSAALVALTMDELQDAAEHAHGILAAAVEHGEEGRNEKPGCRPVSALRLAEALWILGRCELRHGNLDEAYRLARSALDRSIASSYPPMIHRANQLINDVKAARSA